MISFNIVYIKSSSIWFENMRVQDDKYWKWYHILTTISSRAFTVNSGRLYRGHVSDSLRVPAYMMQNDPLSILTPFLLKSVKKWDSAALKTKSGKGSLWGGSKNDNLGQIFYFTWYFIDFSAVMYLFEVKESTLKSFVKIRPSMLKKMVVLHQIKARGRFCCHAHILVYFYVFF